MPAPPHPRRAGVLLPLFSIRTPTGWGLGEIPGVASFARWAGAAGFRVLQLLPVNEITGGETSPYSAATAFALDPVYLGIDACEDFHAAGGRRALLSADQVRLDEAAAAPTVEWHGIRRLKRHALDLAFAHFRSTEWATHSHRAKQLAEFSERESAWLDDFVLFAALHDMHRAGWTSWPEAHRRRHRPAIDTLRLELADALLFRRWCQWQLDEQWRSARREAGIVGVELMGDLPFSVSWDSADVWARQDEFRLDRRVGTPPDAFSEAGQDWGLPAYDWEAMERTDFSWMRARAGRAASLYSLYRIDHVIGLYRTYFRTGAPPQNEDAAGFMPADEASQIRLGETLLGIFAASGGVVAEDLGMVPPFLRPSLTKLGIPGYRVLRWEKDDEVYRDPATWPALSVATSGTHDIESNAAWWTAMPRAGRERLLAIPGLLHLDSAAAWDERVRDALLRVIFDAPSGLAIVPLHDALGTAERINVPGTVSRANWAYRMPNNPTTLIDDRATTDRLSALARRSRRQPP